MIPLNNLLSKYWKNILIIILACLVIAFYRKPAKVIVVNQGQDSMQVAKHYRDLNGQLVAEINQMKISQNEMKARYEQLAHELKIKPKTIQGVDRIKVETKIEYRDTTSIVYRDKDTAYKIELKDSWAHIISIAGRDSGSIKFKHIDTITRVQTSKTKWLGLGSTVHKVLLKNASPHNTVVAGSSFDVKEKRLLLTVGPYGGYDFVNRNWGAGISVQIPLVKIYSKK
jgi:hypothetical protein